MLESEPHPTELQVVPKRKINPCEEFGCEVFIKTDLGMMCRDCGAPMPRPNWGSSPEKGQE